MVVRTITTRLGPDGLAGAFVLVTGLLLWFITRDYPYGELDEIGPGFMPWVASIGLMGLGVVMLGRGVKKAAGGELPVVGRAVLIVPFAMVIFALGLDRLGLFATATVSVFVASLAAPRTKLLERVAFSIVLAAFATLVFGYGLSMTMPIWPAFLRP